MELDTRISLEDAMAAFDKGLQAIKSAGIDLEVALDYAFRAELLRQAKEKGLQTTRVEYRDFLTEDGKIDKMEFLRRVAESHIACINPDGSVTLIGPTTNPQMLP